MSKTRAPQHNYKPEKISVTKDYNLFQRDPTQKMHNREVNAKKHKRLKDSMRKNGFLPCYPIVVFRDSVGKLWIKDGQHRLLFARDLSLPVYFVEVKQDFNVAEINSTPRVWSMLDYVKLYAAHGKEDYQKALDFSYRHQIPIGMACRILEGTNRGTQTNGRVMMGEFTIKDQEFADKVATLYVGLITLQPNCKNARLLEACSAVCTDPGFNPRRLLETAGYCREKLIAYSTRDGFMVMMEEVYNWKKQRLYPLRINALKVLKDRWENPHDGPASKGENGRYIKRQVKEAV